MSCDFSTPLPVNFSINTQQYERKELTSETSFKIKMLNNEISKSTSNVEYISKLQDRVFNILIRDVYAAKNNLPLTDKEIVFMGNVLPDGMGDYYSISLTAEGAKSLFPDLNIRIIVKFTGPLDENRLNSFVLPNKDKFQFNLCEQALSAEAIEKIKDAACVFEVSVAVGDEDWGDGIKIKETMKEKGTYRMFSEYGRVVGAPFCEIQLSSVAVKLSQ